MVNGTEPKDTLSKPADLSEDEDSEGPEGPEGRGLDTQQKQSESSTSDLSDDPDTEEALKGFNFLSEGEEGAEPPEGGGAWGAEEEYRRGRRGGGGRGRGRGRRPNRSKLQNMLATLRDAEERPVAPPPLTTPPLAPPRLSDDQDDDDTTAGKHGEEAQLEGEGGELMDNNQQEEEQEEVCGPRRPPPLSLRSHLDSVRSVTFHPEEPLLLSASDDRTLKLWRLDTPTRKCAAMDVEPVYTFRGHSGPVLCVTLTSDGAQFFSGGADGTIRTWNTPPPHTEPYDPYDSSVLGAALLGHSDAVWGVAYSSAHRRLLSCSADGSVRLWDPAAAAATSSLAVLDAPAGVGVPTSVDVVGCDSAHMVTSFSGGHVGLFDMETQQLLLKIQSADCGINKVLSHPSLPVSIAAHDDRTIRFFDNNTGQVIHSMVAHLDAVTCLAVDPHGLYLMSGSADCSVRVWSLQSKVCVQDVSAHRRKCDESVLSVALHPSRGLMGSGGADALAKVFV